MDALINTTLPLHFVQRAWLHSASRRDPLAVSPCPSGVWHSRAGRSSVPGCRILVGHLLRDVPHRSKMRWVHHDIIQAQEAAVRILILVMWSVEELQMIAVPALRPSNGVRVLPGSTERVNTVTDMWTVWNESRRFGSRYTCTAYCTLYRWAPCRKSGALEQLFCGRASVAATGRNWCCTGLRTRTV